MKTIRGKQALVTGAASGIGRGIALTLAREGADLYLIDIDEAGLTLVQTEAVALGISANIDRCDLSQPTEITRAVNEMLQRGYIPNILVNNAGLAYYGPMHLMSAAQWDRVLNVNLLAPIQLTRELLPKLLEQPEAHVLNVCSISGIVAGGRFAAYHTSKFGLIGFTESLRAEYGRRGLGVTALCPGPVLTNLYKSCASARTDKTVPEPPRWLCSSIDTVAVSAIKAIRRNKRRVLIGPLAHLLSWINWLAPGAIDFLNQFSRKKRKLAVVASEPEQRRAA
jgi:short-subunit dehydrogenase